MNRCSSATVKDRIHTVEATKAFEELPLERIQAILAGVDTLLAKPAVPGSPDVLLRLTVDGPVFIQSTTGVLIPPGSGVWNVADARTERQ